MSSFKGDKKEDEDGKIRFNYILTILHNYIVSISLSFASQMIVNRTLLMAQHHFTI